MAVSINIDRILSVRGLPGRAGESVILFVAALCEWAFVLVPHQNGETLGVQLLVTGVVVWVIVLALVVLALRAPSRQPATWRLTRVVSTQLATVPAILAGASLLGWLPGGLQWLVAGVLASIVVATANAWVLLVEVVRDQRYRPVDGALDRSEGGSS